MMTSTKDLENWVKQQLKPSSKMNSIIKHSHQKISETENQSDDDGYAQVGLLIRADIISHGTLNNFSSEILLNPTKSYGIVVLGNMNSSQVANLAENLSSQILNNDHYTTIEQKLMSLKVLIIR